MCESLRDGVTFTLPMVRQLELDGRNVADRSEQSPVVEPIYPLQCRVFDRIGASPRSPSMNDLRLEQPDDRLCEGIVVGVTGGAHRSLDGALTESLAVADRQVLPAAIAVMDESFGLTARMHGLLERIEYQVRLHRSAHAPTHDHAREHIDDEGDVHEAAPGGDVGEVCDPQLIRSLGHELPLHKVGRTLCAFIGERRDLERPAAPDAAQAERAHQPLHGAASHPDLLAVQLLPGLVSPVGAEVLVPYPPDVLAQLGITAMPRRQLRALELAVLLARATSRRSRARPRRTRPTK